MASLNTMIIIFALLFSTGKCDTTIRNENSSRNMIRSVSINSKIHKTHDMKIKEDIWKICGNTETLNLDKMNLRDIKDNIIQSEQIKHISIQGNRLLTIPGNIFNRVPYLYCINISRNEINLYNSNPFQHSHLKILDISYQNVPKPVYNFLENENEIETIDETKLYEFMNFNNSNIHLPNVEYLILSGNEITNLSSNFHESFPRLTHIYLNDINADTLQLNFFNVIPTTLRVLQLKNNNFFNLTLENMGELTHLYLDGNPLKEIYIMSNKLQILSLSNCTNLHYATLETPNLQYIDLSRTNIESASSVFPFGKYQLLHTILLDYNKFLQTPILKGTQIIKLSLSYNRIKYISQNSFEQLTSLKELSLKGNRIQIIEGNAFLNSKNLEYLDLSENLLKNLPYDWILPMLSLRHLNMNSNQFENIAEMSINSISSLEYLFVKNNTLTEVTTIELNNLPNQITVYLG